MRKILTLLLIIICAFSAAATGTSAWQDFSQHKTNVMTGNFVPEPGELTITKTVVNGDGSPLSAEQEERLFEFTVIFGGGGSYSYRVGGDPEQTIASGEKIELRHGQAAVIPDIPVGVLYIVRETPAASYVTSSVNHQGNITENGATAAFTNTYAPDEFPTGSLRVSKQVAGAGADPDMEFTFTVAFTGANLPDPIRYTIGGAEYILGADGKFKLRHGQTAVFENLPLGTAYTVIEDDYSALNYTAAVREYSGIILGNEILLPFVSVYDEQPGDGTGSLVVSKTVTGEGAEEDREFLFTAVFTGAEGQPPQIFAFTLKHGEMKVFEDLPHGMEYSVTEAEAEGYAASLVTARGTIADETIAAASFVNDKIPTTSLTIRKIVRGEAPESDREKRFAFTVYVNGAALPEKIYLKNGETSAPVEIPIGAAYEVQEDDYTGDGYAQTAVTGGSGIATGEAIEAVKTNTFVGTVTIEISGEKTWDLSKTAAGAALPESITVYLKNGDKTVDTTVVRPQGGRWTYRFTASKYDAAGKEISYSVAEEPVPGYVAAVRGYNITNTWRARIPVTVQKVWKGSDKNRPKSVSVQLLRNGTPYGKPVSLSSANAWKHTWANLDNNAVWTVDELSLPKNYTKTITGDQSGGFVITNTYQNVSGSVTISGTKTWVHGSNPKAKQPENITVQIKNGNYVVKQKAVSAADGWRWSFTLPKYGAGGEAIRYTVSEANVPGYKRAVKGYDITNTFVSANYPGDSPKTGDEGGLWLWFVMMTVGVTGMAGVWQYRGAEKRMRKWRKM
jgi:hypothetical protein